MKENKIIDLHSGKYVFEGSVEDDPNRFLIHIVPPQNLQGNVETSGLDEKNKDLILPIYSNNDKLYIDTKNLASDNYSISIFNTLGSTLLTTQLDNANLNILDFPHKEGYYFIQISSKDQLNSFKVFLN